MSGWVDKTRVTSTILLDPRGEATRAWGVTGTPTVFAIDRGGRLVAKAPGTKPWTSPTGRAFLEALLGS